MWASCFRGFWFLCIPAFFLQASIARADEHRAKANFKLCQSCHGTKGQGDKSIDAPAIAGLPAWYVETQIKKFANGARGGHGKDLVGLRMRPMARTLKTEEDIKDMAALVASLPPKGPGAPTVKGKWLKGESAYQVCVPCHGAKAEGNQAIGAPPLAQQNDWYIVNQLKKFKSKLRGYDATNDAIGAGMAGIAIGLDDEAMNNLATYIHGLGSNGG